MWEDVRRQLAGILKAQVFASLLDTPSYKSLLQKALLEEASCTMQYLFSTNSNTFRRPSEIDSSPTAR
jgi:hypothetical protein